MGLFSTALARPVAGAKKSISTGCARCWRTWVMKMSRPAEIPAKLEAALKALREQGEKPAAPSNAGGDIDATIAAARKRLRDSDPQGALELLKARRGEETQARMRKAGDRAARRTGGNRKTRLRLRRRESDVERTAELDPDAVRGWGELGDSWLTTGNLAEAERAFRAALDAARRQGFSREESVALNRLGDVFVARGKLDEALRSYRAHSRSSSGLAQADPSNTEWRRDLGFPRSNWQRAGPAGRARTGR